LTHVRREISLLSISFLLLINGCYSGIQVKSGESAIANSNEIEVEAYLFDVKIRRHGKPTSFRLDLYQTDSAVAMYGRGYFNKGAFSGRLINDSMQVYFPSTKEHLFESIENLFLSFDCESELIGINLLGYFTEPPAVDSLAASLKIEKMEEEKNSRSFRISSRNCPWFLTLTYTKETEGWRIDDFEFDDNKEVTLKGSRRIYKPEATVSADRFHLSIPDGALKLTL
jgi:hypothetical protein